MVQNPASPLQATDCFGAGGIKLGRGTETVQRTLGMDSVLVRLTVSDSKD